MATLRGCLRSTPNAVRKGRAISEISGREQRYGRHTPPTRQRPKPGTARACTPFRRREHVGAARLRLFLFAGCRDVVEPAPEAVNPDRALQLVARARKPIPAGLPPKPASLTASWWARAASPALPQRWRMWRRMPAGSSVICVPALICAAVALAPEHEPRVRIIRPTEIGSSGADYVRYPFAAFPYANVKSKAPLASVVCQWSFDPTFANVAPQMGSEC